ncbi:phosphatase PAP2 family protein [Flavivirga rizhaonensis]|uniref:Phosphatase PAP2 family protein n=1 Tax=Flavivirga rizhaonensis TaxID=2559571 RepID=A0A4S1E2T3_9FLAO|nr:phosphatase PAP2 family protein [Flavivirga rizhaonensis]TGV04859.1 phosphatase PAP2 family protein [Flavivirga rizhaonensis]
MSYIRIITLVISVFTFPALNSQIILLDKKHLKKEKSLLQKSILPVSIIISGAALSKSFFEKNLQKDIRKFAGNNFHSSIEDYTRYAPIIELYAADILNIKAKNHWFDQTKNLTMSILITDFITYKLKRGIKKERPGSTITHPSYESFPSGHTSFAFANASVLYQEFKDSNKILAYSGYAFAITTGSFRMLNNAHYLSDVLVGAGIAILVTELIYHFEPIKWNPFKKKENITFVPKIGRDDFGKENYGLYFNIRF